MNSKSKKAFVSIEGAAIAMMIGLLVFIVFVSISCAKEQEVETQDMNRIVRETEKMKADRALRFAPIVLERVEKTPEQISQEQEELKAKKAAMAANRVARQAAEKLETERQQYNVRRLFEIDGYTVYAVDYGNTHLVTIPKK